MSMWKRAMEYLGLGPEDAYDDYDMAPEPEQRPVRQARPQRDDMGRPQRGYPGDYDAEVAPVRTVPARPTFPSSSSDSTTMRRPVPAPDDSSVHPRPINPRPATVSRIGAAAGSSSEPYTVRPRRFDAAQEVADKFKEGLPVIMNLEAADDDVRRRLIDFASGLCYGLGGAMEKVSQRVFLLKPTGRAVSHDDDYDYDR